MKELQRLFLQKMSEIAIRHSLPRAVSQASCVLLSLAFCSLWSQASFGQTEIRKLTASDAGSPDRFGESVAISEELVVVGAIGNFVGAVYVFDRNHTGTDMWGEVVKLTAPSAGNFGFSVATDGDLVAVGNLELGGAGGINVFARNNGGPGAWGLVATQTASDGANLDRLGRSITLNGDVIVAGASDHNTDGLSNAGAAYVFGRNEGGMNNWGEITKLTASVPISGQRFGWRIDMSGNTIVVGGPFVQSFGEGSAYVFENIGGTWTETADDNPPRIRSRRNPQIGRSGMISTQRPRRAASRSLPRGHGHAVERQPATTRSRS